MKRTGKYGILAGVIVAVSFLISGASARACSVPVYEYALERWTANPYDVVVFHKGELSSSDQELIDLLKKYEAGDKHNSNIFVSKVDLSKEVDKDLKKLWEKEENAQLPWMVVVSPPMWRPARKVWSAPFDTAHVKRLLDSPARRTIGKSILDGDVAVWVLLESGNEKKDKKAAETLQNNLDKVTKQIKKEMEMMYPTAPAGAPGAAQSEGDKDIEFSVITMSRDNPDEAAFRSMLMESEKDLHEYADKPMAFPLFGRGRALFALVGPGINEQNIMEACGFLVGWCSCTAKAMAPGKDMVMSVHWDMHLWSDQPASDSSEEVQLTSLAGLSAFQSTESDTGAEEKADKTAEKSDASSKEPGTAGQSAKKTEAASASADSSMEPQELADLQKRTQAAPQSETDEQGGLLQTVLWAIGGLVLVVGAASIIAVKKTK